MDGNVSTVNIFVASSGELAGERKELIQIVDSIENLYDHLTLKVIKWETGLESGSYQKQRVQDAINPLLEKSQIVIVMVYSKLGKFTLEEYNLAMEKGKKVFLYFKQGFSPKSLDQGKNHQEVLGFRARIEEENKAIFKDYETIDQFKLSIHKDLELYLKKAYPPPVLVEGKAEVPKYLTPQPPRNVELVGREAELEEMARMLKQSHLILLVNGLGGVGKTELCKRYFWDHMDAYDHLAWVDVVGSLRESMVAAFNPETTGCCETDTVDERFEKIMAVLNRLDKGCLLVTDNIENADDADLDGLRALPITVIANSRLTIEGFGSHTLEFLSPENCKKLFYNFYTGKRDNGNVEKIIHRCGRHTLTLELLAKTAENAAMSLEELYKVLVEKGFDPGDVIGEEGEVHTFWHNEKEKKRFFDHLLTIFDLSGVTDQERHILANLSVLPPVVIPIPDVREWLKLKNLKDVNSLVSRGWLRKKGEEGFGIFMHQVIQEVTRYLTSPDVEGCKNLIASLTTCLSLKPTENPIDKKKYIIFAETLLGHIEKKDEALATLSSNLSSRLYQLGSLEKALEFQSKALNIREQVLDKNHPDLATSYNNLSLIYQALGQPEKALEFQLKALNIREQVLDKNHPSLATSYNNLALIYKAIKDYERAETYGEKAVAILQHLFPNGHPNLEKAKDNLEGIRTWKG